mgnify:CR=1 FL=1
MTFDYTSNGLTQSEKDSIENNISTIASTPYATAPFIRNMGIKKISSRNAIEYSRESIRNRSNEPDFNMGGQGKSNRSSF